MGVCRRNNHLIVCFVFLLQGCVSAEKTPAEQLLGRWQSSIGGFPIETQYTEFRVKVGNNKAVEYQLTDARLTITDGVTQVRLLSFPDDNRMVQTDPLTNTRHEFVRLFP